MCRNLASACIIGASITPEEDTPLPKPLCVSRAKEETRRRRRRRTSSKRVFVFFSPFERAKSFGVERHGKERGRRR